MVVGGNRKGRTIKQNSCVHVTKSSHLWKVCRKPRGSSHLRKVGNGENIRKRLCTCCVGTVAQTHLRKVCRKPRGSSHLRKVGNGENIRKRLCTCCIGAVAQFHLRKVCRKPRESSHLRKVGKREDGTAGELAGSVRLEKCIQCGEIFFCMGECGLEVLAVEFTEGDERGGGPVFRTQQPTPTERYVRHRFWV